MLLGKRSGPVRLAAGRRGNVILVCAHTFKNVMCAAHGRAQSVCGRNYYGAARVSEPSQGKGAPCRGHVKALEGKVIAVHGLTSGRQGPRREGRTRAGRASMNAAAACGAAGGSSILSKPRRGRPPNEGAGATTKAADQDRAGRGLAAFAR